MDETLRKKVKLRKLTLDEYKKYIEQHCRDMEGDCSSCIFGRVNCDYNDDIPWRSNRQQRVACWIYEKDLYRDSFLDQEVEIEKDPLDDVEREYLRAVIKPFIHRNPIIVKHSYRYEGIESEYIFIKIEGNGKYAYNRESIRLPLFEKDSMYRGMVPEKEYTVEELELFK